VTRKRKGRKRRRRRQRGRGGVGVRQIGLGSLRRRQKGLGYRRRQRGYGFKDKARSFWRKTKETLGPVSKRLGKAFLSNIIKEVLPALSAKDKVKFVRDRAPSLIKESLRQGLLEQSGSGVRARQRGRGYHGIRVRQPGLGGAVPLQAAYTIQKLLARQQQ